MPIGPYSPCPGGTGNKIKFCCPTLLSELQKIERMLEGEQYQACLRHVEQLEKSNPDKACLLSIKTELLRVLEKSEDARAAAAVFLEKHPNNPVALAESALHAGAGRESRRAVELILEAMTASGREMHPRVYQAMDSLCRFLAMEGHVQAAQSLATLQLNIDEEDRRVMGFLMQLNSAPGLPLLLKGERRLRTCPEGMPWKAEFDEAASLASKVRLAQAAERFAELAERVDGEPVLWRNLATLRGWLADTPGCIQALRKLATLDVPLEEAVEAEALALFLSDDPLGDRQDVLSLRYTVHDAERLQAALSSTPKATQLQADLASLATEDSPPPKGVFALFDREMPDSDAELSPETLPRLLCQALLYGKETDRDARLEVGDVAASNLGTVKALLAEAAGDALDGEPEQEVIGQTSATRQLLSPSWRMRAGLTRQEFRRLTEQQMEHALLETWPQSRLGLLDDKCPQEVADQEAYRIRLLAAIMVLDFWLEQIGGRFDFNRLRSRLGLPTLEPIDPEQTPWEQVPLVRLSRVVAEKLPDDALVDGYRRALAYTARAAVRKFAQAVVERSSLAGRRERLLAFEMMATMTEDSGQALDYLDQGRQLAKQAGQSCARWDLLELPLRLEREEAEEASGLLDHLQSQHINEPGVARALTELLIDVGVLNPDGTPAGVPEAPAAEEPSLVVPGQGGAKPGELWTPESQRPAGDKPKIWTPGMD